MRLSRRIRRQMSRVLPEWMMCFARSVNQRVRNLVDSGKLAARKLRDSSDAVWQFTRNKLHNSGQKLATALREGTAGHQKEWAAAALAVGMLVAPYAAGNEGVLGNTVAHAMPQEGTVVGGQATIEQQNNVMNVNQSTQRAAIDWTSFNIASQETVNFNQPGSNSVALNRVIGNSGSEIYGHLNANGIVYLANQNGVYFAPGSEINVAGLVATTSKVDPQQFMKDGTIDYSQRNASINAQGNIFASGGLVRIAGATAINQSGVVRASRISGDGGTIEITDADDISVSGTLNAGATANGNGGTVSLVADKADGALDINGATLLARGGSVAGNGGYIETSGYEVKGLDKSVVNAGAVNGNAGTWLIDPYNFTIVSGQGAQSNTTIGADTLATSLNTQNVSISTDNSSTGIEAGDINVNAGVTWTADNSLSLSAYHDVNVNANITDTAGSGSVILRADSTGLGDGTVTFSSGKKISLGTAGYAKIYYNPTALGTPTDYSSNLSVAAGHGIAYQLVNNAAQLASIGNNGSWWRQNFALGKNIDMTGVNYKQIGWSEAADWYFGQFDGLNNTISNLSINTTALDNAGMFGVIAAAGAVSNLTLADSHVTAAYRGLAYVGMVAGVNSGTMSNISVLGGTVKGGTEQYAYDSTMVGGIAGYNSGVLSNVNVNGTSISVFKLSGDDCDLMAGGVVGYNNAGGTVTGASVSTVTISAVMENVQNGKIEVGGIAALNESGATVTGVTVVDTTLNISSATDTYEDYYAGGVNGVNRGTLDGFSAAGNTLSGDSKHACLGGAVGGNSGGDIKEGTIYNNTLGGQALAGGQIAGYVDGGMINSVSVDGGMISFAVDDVVNYIGGAVGLAIYGSVSNVAVSNVTVMDKDVRAGNIGGLVGNARGGTFDGNTVRAVSLSVVPGLNTTMNCIGGEIGCLEGGAVLTGADTRVVVTGGSVSMNYTSGGVIDITSLTGANAVVSQVGESTLTLGATNITSTSGVLTVAATGNVTQEAGTSITADTAVVSSSSTDGSIILGSTANMFGTLALTGASATVGYSGDLTLARTSVGNLGLNVSGAVLESDSVFATTATIISGSVNLGSPGNQIDTLSVTSGAVTVANYGNITLGGSSVSSLNLTAGGDVTQTAALNVDELQVSANGDITLNNADNSIEYLRFNASGNTAGNVHVVDKDSVTLFGANGGQTVFVSAAGITIDRTSTVTADGSGTALVLVSDGGFVNNYGDGALNTPDGNWQVYSSDPADGSRNGQDYDFKQYNATYGSAVLGSGNGFLYSVQAGVSGTLGGSAIKTYDGDTKVTDVQNITVTSATGIDGDTIVSSKVLAAEYATPEVGTSKLVTATVADFTAVDNEGKTVYGYTLAPGEMSGTIGTVKAVPRAMDPDAPRQAALNRNWLNLTASGDETSAKRTENILRIADTGNMPQGLVRTSTITLRAKGQQLETSANWRLEITAPEFVITEPAESGGDHIDQEDR